MARLVLVLAAAVILLFGVRDARAGEAPLTAAETRAFMAEVAAASTARDVARLAALLAPDCRIELRAEIDGREQETLYTRQEYVAMLTSGYAAMADLADYDYHVDAQDVTLDDDPPGATVVSRITESFTFQQRHRVTQSEETARVERRGGRPLLVAVSSLTHAAR